MATKRCPADTAFSNAVRLSKGYQCEHCHKSDGTMECAHIFGRRHKSIRWDTMNALCLCHACHRKFTENPVSFTRFLEATAGRGYLDILNEKKNRIFKVTPTIRKEIAAHYRAQVKELESGERRFLESYQ
jgi:hypothetical protein